MRIVIDLQGNQSTGSRNRGIGRYSQALSYHICKNATEHEVHLVLNGAFSECIQQIRVDFAAVLPASHIHVFDVLTPCGEIDVANTQRRQLNEAMREAFIGALQPDMVLVTSLFEGLGDDTVTSVNAYTHLPTAVVLYDLIPYIHQSPYLENPLVKNWYLHKIHHATQADLLLSISRSSGQEAIQRLGIPAQQVVTISTACDDQFQPIDITKADLDYFSQKYHLTKPFVMYTGGIDFRKNIEGLIRAYAALPLAIRQPHQLAIVCSVQPAEQARLELLAQTHGLGDTDFIMTGFVSEEDLVKLYNACKLFVFPSWHEGFGLPALEAMQCGAAVIASNNSSLPEVVGWDEALFDPLDDKSIIQKLQQGLTDEAFRQKLITHGRQQAKKFNWDDIAQRAIGAFQNFYTHQQISKQNLRLANLTPSQIARPKLAYLSPLPPLQSGISNYSAELLNYLTRWYDITVIVNQDIVTDGWITANIAIQSVDWFKQNSQQFERVIYHFGNSEFHQHMFDLLSVIPGVVVLHDFYLSGIQAYREHMDNENLHWRKNLFYSHGYQGLQLLYNETYPQQAMWIYPANLKVIQDSLGMIVHSENSKRLARDWYGNHLDVEENWHLIPLLREVPISNDKNVARKILNIPQEAFVVCSFGIIGETKHTLELIQAYSHASLSTQKNCYLILVGKQPASGYSKKIDAAITAAPRPKNIQITGWTEAEEFRLYLQAADIGVQLRTLSRGETSGTVLDCMNYGLATIVNANGSMADLEPDCVYLLPDEFSVSELSHALDTLQQDSKRRKQLGEKAQQLITSQHNPYRCAAMYVEAIETIYKQQHNNLYGLIQHLEQHTLTIDAQDSQQIVTLAQNFPARPRLRQLFIDISELVQRDSKTGIQRVVRAILGELLKYTPTGYRIEPVYAYKNQEGYLYAREFTCGFLDIPNAGCGQDEGIDYYEGDIFLGLDLQPTIVSNQVDFLKAMQKKGVKISFIIYDLIAINFADYFSKNMTDNMSHWLSTVTQFNQLICISQAIADSVYQWLTKNSANHAQQNHPSPLRLDWFHLGSDIQTSKPSTGLPANAERTLATLQQRPTFLMVGTLEPRKGYSQVLAAFEMLWQAGQDINLVFVGKKGWEIEELVSSIQQHKEYNRRLFWLEAISDEYLEKIYATADCLIAASYTEGFGLPLIEAAQHNLPIIARDIPVFREVAKEHAVYFADDANPNTITHTVQHWLKLSANNQLPDISTLSILTWQQSTEQLINCLLGITPAYRYFPNT